MMKDVFCSEYQYRAPRSPTNATIATSFPEKQKLLPLPKLSDLGVSKTQSSRLEDPVTFKA